MSESNCYTESRCRHCVRCPPALLTRHRWLERGYLHAGDRGYILCSFCHRCYACRYCQRHWNAASQTCTFDSCKMILSSVAECIRHIERTHRTIVERFCSSCPGKSFDDERSARAHIESRHRWNHRKPTIIKQEVPGDDTDDDVGDISALLIEYGEFLSCFLCRVKFTDQRDFKLHLIRAHQEPFTNEERNRLRWKRYQAGCTFYHKLAVDARPFWHFERVLKCPLVDIVLRLRPNPIGCLDTAGNRLQLLHRTMLLRLRDCLNRMPQRRLELIFAEVRKTMDGFRADLEEVWHVSSPDFERDSCSSSYNECDHADSSTDAVILRRRTPDGDTVCMPSSALCERIRKGQQYLVENRGYHTCGEPPLPDRSQSWLSVGDTFYKDYVDRSLSFESFSTSVCFHLTDATVGFYRSRKIDFSSCGRHDILAFHNRIIDDCCLRLTRVRYWGVEEIYDTLASETHLKERLDKIWRANKPEDEQGFRSRTRSGSALKRKHHCLGTDYDAELLHSAACESFLRQLNDVVNDLIGVCHLSEEPSRADPRKNHRKSGLMISIATSLNEHCKAAQGAWGALSADAKIQCLNFRQPARLFPQWKAEPGNEVQTLAQLTWGMLPMCDDSLRVAETARFSGDSIRILRVACANLRKLCALLQVRERTRGPQLRKSLSEILKQDGF